MNLSKYKKQIFSFIFIFSFFSLVICPVFAQGTLKDVDSNLTTFGEGAGFDPTETDIDLIVGSVIKYALSFLGVIFLVLLIYGGFIWMNARGDSEEVKKAKDIMINAIIGIGIVLGAYILTSWIVGRLVASTIKPEDISTTSYIGSYVI